MPIILHVIETLGRGGAEVMFVNYINSLPPIFKNIVVYLREPTTLEYELSNVLFAECLDFRKKLDIPKISFKLNRIIKKHQVNLIHSHLYWPTIVARIANVGKLPHIFSVHTIMTYDAFKPNRLSKYLEKLTYSSQQTALFVSRAAYSDYQSHIRVSGKTAVLYNFIRDDYFEPSVRKVNFEKESLRLVSVGNLRPQKGYLFLLKCLQALSGYNISLDIYGEGHQEDELVRYLEVNRITHVRLMGSHPQPWTILKEYDAFVLATQYEGFCLAMAEAMAVGLPCVVPALDALIEISGNQQLYFPLDNEKVILNKILELYHNAEKQQHFSRLASEQAEKFTKEIHMHRLVGIYQEELKAI